MATARPGRRLKAGRPGPGARELRPTSVDKPEYYDALEAEIVAAVEEVVFRPVILALGLKSSDVLSNSVADLAWAIQQGQIAFTRGAFSGRFNAKLSKQLREMGAVWDRTRKVFKIGRDELPDEIRHAIDASEARFMARVASATKHLEGVTSEDIAARLDLGSLIDRTLFRVDESFRKNVEAVTVAPELTAYQRKRIAAEYSKTVHLHIQGWAQRAVEKLRTEVVERARAGGRYEQLAKVVAENYDQSRSRAKFIARQETKLLMTKFKQTRYQEAGVHWYRWRCVHNPKDTSPTHHTPGNVRYYHGLLDGGVFRWDDPPVVDADGNRKNPQQDYNCRCTAIPVVDFAEE